MNYIGTDQVFEWLMLDKESFDDMQANPQHWTPLRAEDIVAMKMEGFDFGSHTLSHCPLSQADKSTVQTEIKASKDWLEKIIGEPVRCFSYPYGDVSQSAKNYLKSCGYDCAVGIGYGINTQDTDMFELKRTSVSGWDSQAKFIRKINGAYDWLEWVTATTSRIKRMIRK